MKTFKTGTIRSKFKLLHATRSAQAAMMMLPAGGTSDESPSNEHASSEQWVFILAGLASIRIGKSKRALRTVRIGRGMLLLIEKGELHQIKNIGRGPLRFLNLYVPPAYDSSGEPIS
jgi:oxalate decarboxylase/phosphoglucose isomerase-like protein (cupin superfamily)